MKKNNVFKYSTDAGLTWKIIRLETGSYELSAINDVIARHMIVNGDYNREENSTYISIYPNISTLKSIVDITNNNYRVDFTIENSIAPLLGFTERVILRHGQNIFSSIVNIMSVNSILVNVDMISGSYMNDKQSFAIYSFYPNVPPGYKLIKEPFNLVYYPINKRSYIDSVRVWFTDQNQRPIDLQEETWTISLVIRKI